MTWKQRHESHKGEAGGLAGGSKFLQRESHVQGPGEKTLSVIGNNMEVGRNMGRNRKMWAGTALGQATQDDMVLGEKCAVSSTRAGKPSGLNLGASMI